MEKKIKVENKEALKKYIVEKEYTMGVCLSSKDIRGFKSGNVDISKAWCTIKNDEMFIVNMRIRGSAIKGADGKLTNPQRKLLEHRNTLDDIIKDVFRNKLAIVPIEAFSNDEGLMKIHVALCKKNPDYVPPVKTEKKEKPAYKNHGGRKPYKKFDNGGKYKKSYKGRINRTEKE